MRARRAAWSSVGGTCLVAAAILGASRVPDGIAPASAAPSATAASSTSGGAAPAPSATSAASAGAAPDPAALVASYAWPTSASPEPNEADWAGAHDLGAATVSIARSPWVTAAPVPCRQRAVREWVRVTCAPNHEEVSDTLLGVIWALAGDTSTVKATFSLASELPRYAAAPTDRMQELTRKMGAAATVTFQARPGSAILLTVDEMGWDEGYDGASAFSSPGIVLDVSWALGEKAPTILYR